MSTSAPARVIETLTKAHKDGRRVRPVGAGSWTSAWGLDGNTPAEPGARLPLAEHAEVIEYEPADLTMTVGAGVTLETIAALTRPNAQWLAVDPIGEPSATIGATVATGSSGALRAGFGGIRDHVLGLTLVTGDGRTLELGGRVVKNVAGFDLLKLMVGGWGRFGVITEVTVRLHPLPARDLTMVFESEDPNHLYSIARTLATAPIVPAALRLDFRSGRVCLAARVVGSAPSAPEEMRVLEATVEPLASPQQQLAGEASERFWADQARPPGPEATECAVSFNPRELASVGQAMETAHAAGWRIRCDVTEGLCSVEGAAAPIEPLSRWVGSGASLRVLKASEAERPLLESLQEAADPAVHTLVSRLVHAFDPSGVLG